MRRWAFCREAEAAQRFTNCVAREGIFSLRLAGENERREALSLGRFAERVGSWLHFAAAEVPCFCFLFRSNGKGRARAPAARDYL